MPVTMAELPPATPIGPWAVQAGAVSSSPSSRDLPNPDTKRHAGAFRHGETPVPRAVPHDSNSPEPHREKSDTPRIALQTCAPTSARGQQRPRQHGNFPVVTTHGNDRIDHAVFSDAVHEIRDQGCVVTDVGFQLSDCRQAVRDFRDEPPTIRGERLLNVCSARSNGLREDFGWLRTDTAFVGSLTRTDASRTGYFRRMARFTEMH